MATRWARFVRGWVTALLSVFIAAGSHVAGGGSIPGQLGVTLAVVVAGLVCVALAGKSLSRVRLGISVALSQFAFHLLFSLGAGAGAGASSMTMMHGGSAHQHGAMVLEVGATGSASAGSMVDDPSMWIAHAVAAAITIVLLRRGETAFWGLLELARATWVAVFIPRLVVVAAVPVDTMRVRLAVTARSGLRDLGVILSGRPHRGPPQRFALSS